MLTFVLCDDSTNILNKLEKMLYTIFTKNNLEASISFKSTNATDLLDFVNCNKVDVIILDINLQSERCGLELAESIRKVNKNAYIIFITGHLEYALVAYKFKTFDYIAKPITYDRLESSILRLFDDAYGTPKRYIKIDAKNTLIDADEIFFIERDGMKLIFHTASCNYETYSSFNKFQDKLPDYYKRCHKSYVANLSKIKYVEPISNVITFKDESTCRIGPKYKSELLEVLSSYGIYE